MSYKDLTPMEQLVVDYARKAGHDPVYYLAVAAQESGFNPWAQAGDSRDIARGGSRGLFQMSWKTAQGIGFKGEPDALYKPSVALETFHTLTALNMGTLGAIRTRYGIASEQYVKALYSLHNAGRVLAHPGAELQSHLDSIWKKYKGFQALLAKP